MPAAYLRIYQDDLSQFPHSWGGKLRLCAGALVNYFRSQASNRWHTITIAQLANILMEFSHELVRVACQELTKLGIIDRQHHRLNPRAWQYRLVRDDVEEPVTARRDIEEPVATCSESDRVGIRIPNDEEYEPVSTCRESKSDWADVRIPKDKEKLESAPVINRRPKRKIDSAGRERYEWEIAVNEPFPAFLQWRAKDYEKQSGSLGATPTANAESEFYNNPQRAARLYQQFLRRAQVVIENEKEQLAAGNTPVLPSEYLQVAPPEPTKIMNDLQTLIDAGAQVQLPSKHPSDRKVVPYQEYQSLVDAEWGKSQTEKLPWKSTYHASNVTESSVIKENLPGAVDSCPGQNSDVLEGSSANIGSEQSAADSSTEVEANQSLSSYMAPVIERIKLKIKLQEQGQGVPTKDLPDCSIEALRKLSGQISLSTAGSPTRETEGPQSTRDANWDAIEKNVAEKERKFFTQQRNVADEEPPF